MASVEALQQKAEEAEAALIELVNEKDAYLEDFKAKQARLQTKYEKAQQAFMEAREVAKTDEQRALDQQIGG